MLAIRSSDAAQAHSFNRGEERRTGAYNHVTATTALGPHTHTHPRPVLAPPCRTTAGGLRLPRRTTRGAPTRRGNGAVAARKVRRQTTRREATRRRGDGRRPSRSSATWGVERVEDRGRTARVQRWRDTPIARSQRLWHVDCGCHDACGDQPERAARGMDATPCVGSTISHDAPRCCARIRGRQHEEGRGCGDAQQPRGAGSCGARGAQAARDDGRDSPTMGRKRRRRRPVM